jgi:hypothetical protein
MHRVQVNGKPDDPAPKRDRDWQPYDDASEKLHDDSLTAPSST